MLSSEKLKEKHRVLSESVNHTAATLSRGRNEEKRLTARLADGQSRLQMRKELIAEEEAELKKEKEAYAALAELKKEKEADAALAGQLKEEAGKGVAEAIEAEADQVEAPGPDEN